MFIINFWSSVLWNIWFADIYLSQKIENFSSFWKLKIKKTPVKSVDLEMQNIHFASNQMSFNLCCPV